ncbi:TPA: LacI family DNA-binding transcriptional regulator [Streptococcus suis]
MEMNKSITMKDVAKLAGVSVGTVSRVINGKTDLKPITLEKVNSAITELNYIPDAYARGMKLSRTNTVALIIPSIWHPFFSEFAYYVESALVEANYKLLLCNTNGAKKDLEYIQMLQQNKVDGIIAITYNPIEDYLTAGIPFVSIDRSYSEKGIAWISSDNKEGGKLAAAKLLEKGCQTFAFVGSYNSTSNETKKRRIYFEKTIKEANKVCHIFELEEPYVDFQIKLKEFLTKNPEIDGIFTVNDYKALDTISVLEELGRRVPQDVQVIGYDGIRYGEEREYPVTTIKQPIEQMAQKSVEVLLNIIDGHPHDEHLVLPISYYEGKTTKN